MTNAIRCSLLLLFILSGCAAAQTPVPVPLVRDVELCELDIHPKAYDGQFVRVHGNVNFEFEDFTLHANCTLGTANYPASIWLTYGGDEPEASTYCCGSRSATPGNGLEIDGHKVGLVRDSQYYKLRSSLEAGRLTYPDGTPCYYAAPECKFYTDVQATLTGLFMAKRSTDFGGGYGHFGMFHLLAIQQVSKVSAERTSVPAGGQFRCEQQYWETQCSNEQDCRINSPFRFQTIAAHWNDSFNVEKGNATSSTEINGTIVGKWVSEDLLTTYSTETGETVEPPFTMTVTRQTCTPVSARRKPLPSSATVSCKSYSRSWEEDKEAARRWSSAFSEEEKKEHPSWNAPWAIVAEVSQKLFPENEAAQNTEPNTLGWLILKGQLQKWDLLVEPDIQPRGCQEDSAITNVALSDCQWFSADGMKSYSVNLIKYQPEGSNSDINVRPWLVYAISVRTCQPEP